MPQKNFTRKIFYWQLLLLLLIAGCRTATVQESETQHQRYAIEATAPVDSAVWKTIQPYKDSLANLMDEVLAQSAYPMEKAKPEGLLGNFVSDLVLHEARRLYPSVDFCVLNNGGLRTPLPEGDIPRGKLFELMPFENELVVLKMDEALLKKLADYIIRQGGVPVAGMKIEIRPDSSYTFTINGKSLHKGPFYMVTSDYLANGGDYMGFLSETEQRINLDYKLRDAIICYVQRQGEKNEPLKANLDGRIRFVQ